VLNGQLIDELPLLVELRIREWTTSHLAITDASLTRLSFSLAYLDPSFEAMVRCQLRFAEEGYSKLAGVQR
jgi:hypothetical protein